MAATSLLIAALCSMPLAATANDDKVDPKYDFMAVWKETLPEPAKGKESVTAVHGVLFGQPFVADDARINSFSLVLKQKHKIYSRVVINFTCLRLPLPEQSFYSGGKLVPEVSVYQRLKNGEKLRSKIDYGGAHCSFKVEFGKRNRTAASDTTPGALILRFDNGDYVTGTFVARQSPRVIWDDETIE
jgi:hypothetical protein